MSWNKYHSESERLAAEAENAMINGETSMALELYEKAASEETKALDALDQTKKRTLGITAVSAVSLWYKSLQFSFAEQTAYRCLNLQSMPEFAIDSLRSLLQSVWNEVEMKKAGIKFSAGQVLVSVKGGEVVRGGAPLGLIVEKVQTVQSYFYRTAEFLKKIPHRKRGTPEKEIQEMCRPWLFQAVPGSYQFAVAVQEPIQQDLFGSTKPSAKEIAASFLSILRASIEDPENELQQLVPDVDYQGTFLKLTRNLVPTGKSYEEMEIRAANETKSISLVPAARETINKSLKKHRKLGGDVDDKEEQSLHGILRAVHLDRDWLEITVENEHIHVSNIGDAVDDVIGPMINRPVIVKSFINKKGQHEFIDIESAG